MTTEENSTPTSTRRFVVSVVNIMHALGHVNLQGVPVLYPLLRDHFAFGYMGIAFLTLVRQLVMGVSQSYSHLVIGTVTRSFGLTPYHPVGGAIMVALFPEDRAKALGLY